MDVTRRLSIGVVVAVMAFWMACGSPTVNNPDSVTQTSGGNGNTGDGAAETGDGSSDHEVDGGATKHLSPPVVHLPRTSITAEELAILVNTSDPQSVAVARYYQEAHRIPDRNVIEIQLPIKDVLTRNEFATAKASVDAAAGPGIQAYVLTWTRPYRADCMSITSAFALGFNSKYCSSHTCGLTATTQYYNSSSSRPFTDLGIRPSMMLAAATADEAKKLIDRGVASIATFPTGDGYLITTTDPARSVRGSSFLRIPSQWNHEGGLYLTHINNAGGTRRNYISNTPDVLFYFTGLTSVPAIRTNTYKPGAVADHLTSYGGQVPTSSQMSVVAWLEAGVTASYGTVVEPCAYTEKFPEVPVLLSHYFRGETVLEAYWKSVAWPGEGLFVGDPLAQPWGSTVTTDDGRLTIRTTVLDPRKRYELREADDEAGPYVPALTDIAVPYEMTFAIALEKAAGAYYTLVEKGSP